MTDEKHGVSPEIQRPVAPVAKRRAGIKDGDRLNLREQIVETIHAAIKQSRWLGTKDIANDIGSTAAEVLQSIKSKPLNQEYFLAAKVTKSTLPALIEEFDNAPVYTSDDVDRLAASDQLFQFAARVAEIKRRAKGKAMQTAAKQFAADGVDNGPLRSAFENAVTLRLQNGRVEPYGHLLKRPPPPKPPTVAKLAARLIDVLRNEAASEQDYPLARSKLLALAKIDPHSADLVKIFASKTFHSNVVRIDSSKDGSEIVRYVLADDLPRFVVGFIGWAIEWLAHTEQGPAASTIFPAEIVAETLSNEKKSQKKIADAIQSAAERRLLPAHIGWLRSRGERQFFNQTAVESSSDGRTQKPAVSSMAMPTSQSSDLNSSFELSFDAAFRLLNERKGNTNFLRIDELRRELTQFQREEFDTGLLGLERADRYTLEPAQGGAVKLSDAERVQGILRNQSLLFYVKRIS